jgi:hypothetical protein
MKTGTKVITTQPITEQLRCEEERVILTAGTEGTILSDEGDGMFMVDFGETVLCLGEDEIIELDEAGMTEDDYREPCGAGNYYK